MSSSPVILVVVPTRWNDAAEDHVSWAAPSCLTITDAMVDAGLVSAAQAMMERHGANHRAEIQLQRPDGAALGGGTAPSVMSGRVR
jgi:hypothetical protein